MPSKKIKPERDAIAILHRRYVDGDPEMHAMLEEERANGAVARKICALREKAGLFHEETHIYYCG